MAIYLFAASIIFVVFVARIKRIRVLSPYGIFIAFQILYNVAPWATAASGIASGIFGLLSDLKLVNLQLILSSISIFCFGLVYLVFYRPVAFKNRSFTFPHGMRRNYLLLALPLFLITCVLCEQYGWHQLASAQYASLDASSPGGLYTVTAYVKFLFVAVYLYYLYRFGLDWGAWILLAEHLAVMVVDGARATFVPVFLVTLFMLIDKTPNQKRLKVIYFMAIVGFILSMLTRALAFKEFDLIQGVIAPVTIEGTMGDYSTLQSIYGVQRAINPRYSLGGTYLLDPVILLLPQAVGRDQLLYSKRWSDSLEPVLDDAYAPMGGFYYLSEAIAAYSYAGPPLITVIYALMLLLVDSKKNEYRLLYMAWMSTIGLGFVKVPFTAGLKLFLILFLCLIALKGLSKIKFFLPSISAEDRTLPTIGKTVDM